MRLGGPIKLPQILFILLILNFRFSHAELEEVDDVALIKSFYLGKNFKDKNSYLPLGYELSGEAKGDLNGDNIDDLAIILHKRPAGKKNDEVQTGFDLQYDLRQYVVILTGNKSGGWTTWKIGENHFLNTMPNQMMENGFKSMTISKGVLSLASDFAMSMGGWSAGGCTQKWRNSKSGFQLIGLTVDDSDRKCACGTKIDSNFVTGKTVVTSDKNVDGSPIKKIKRRIIKEKPQILLWENFNYEKRCSAE